MYEFKCGGNIVEPKTAGVDMSNIRVCKLLHAMMAWNIPMGVSDAWAVEFSAIPGWMKLSSEDQTVQVALKKYDDVVMVDHIIELKTHLEFIFRAYGHILITGLGLGCIARGLLHYGQIKSITIVEREIDVIDLVWPYMDSNIRLIHADALEWASRTGERFDMAYHDLWDDPARQERHLSIIHADIMARMRKKTGYQWAWRFPRAHRRLLESATN